MSVLFCVEAFGTFFLTFSSVLFLARRENKAAVTFFAFRNSVDCDTLATGRQYDDCQGFFFAVSKKQRTLAESS